MEPKFLVDENVEYSIVQYLRKQEHDVLSVVEFHPALDDADILQKAVALKKIHHKPL